MMEKDTSKMAQQIWSMLDNLAVDDPESYRKFIEKQLKEGKEALKPPSPHMCVQTVIYSKENNDTLFINIMEWTKVPSPKTNEDAIPTFGGPIYSSKEKGDGYKCVSVAFNPSILEEYGLDSHKKEEINMLICLAIDYIQDVHKVSISKNYSILSKSTRCKGPQALAVQSLVQKFEGKGETFEKQLHDLEVSLGPLASGCKDSLLNQLSGFSGPDNMDLRTEEVANKLVFPNEAHTKSGGTNRLIEELSSTSVVLVKPEFQLEIKENGDSDERSMELKINLPGVSSASECSVDISDDDVYLLVPEKYELTLNLPHKTSVGETSAQFFKRTSSLLLTLPIRN